MSRDARRILEDTLKLPVEARSALAFGLIESLDTEVDEDAEKAWRREIARRVRELSLGKVKTIPWVEARRRILGRPAKPR